jgi:membrane carboxypeptidase/penicillin-binding protein PbpC
VVVSESLAYLMENVLSDEAARGLGYGQGSPLDIGRPAGVQVGQTSTGADNWALGFTPSRLVGVRVGNADGERMEGVNALNGAAPIWQALLRYATRALPPAGWDAPAGISLVDVCDPSGNLPTPYCPDVVREVFLAGTEPTHVDTFYQPYQINRETGKLATLFTPPDLIEDRVFFVPPPEAEPWARQAGIETPPTEYDTYAPPPGRPEVSLTSPEPFALVRGRVALRGSAEGDGFDVYRLRYGEGLNPRAWVQIGEDGLRPAHVATLGTWDTQGLDGLYTLQLMVVRADGAVEAAYVPVTIDNVAPEVDLVLPAADSVFTWPETTEVLIQVEASDANGVVHVEFYVDGKRISTVIEAPWSFRWPVGAAGRHTIQARATDAAGNIGESQSLDIIVER